MSFSQSFGLAEPDFGSPAVIQQLRFAYINASLRHITRSAPAASRTLSVIMCRLARPGGFRVVVADAGEVMVIPS